MAKQENELKDYQFTKLNNNEKSNETIKETKRIRAIIINGKSIGAALTQEEVYSWNSSFPIKELSFAKLNY
jgi:hypothetical protein